MYDESHARQSRRSEWACAFVLSYRRIIVGRRERFGIKWISFCKIGEFQCAKRRKETMTQFTLEWAKSRDRAEQHQLKRDGSTGASTASVQSEWAKARNRRRRKKKIRCLVGYRSSWMFFLLEKVNIFHISCLLFSCCFARCDIWNLFCLLCGRTPDTHLIFPFASIQFSFLPIRVAYGQRAYFCCVCVVDHVCSTSAGAFDTVHVTRQQSMARRTHSYFELSKNFLIILHFLFSIVCPTPCRSIFPYTMRTVSLIFRLCSFLCSHSHVFGVILQLAI